MGWGCCAVFLHCSNTFIHTAFKHQCESLIFVLSTVAILSYPTVCGVGPCAQFAPENMHLVKSSMLYQFALHLIYWLWGIHILKDMWVVNILPPPHQQHTQQCTSPRISLKNALNHFYTTNSIYIHVAPKIFTCRGCLVTENAMFSAVETVVQAFLGQHACHFQHS